MTCIHGRPDLTEFVLRYWSGLEVPGVHFVRLAVHSGEGVDLPVVDNWWWLYWPNEPLSEKFNAGMRELRFFNLDAVMVIGSDDLANAQYVEAAIEALEPTKRFNQLPAFASAGFCYFLDESGLNFTLAKSVGAGRIIPRRTLDALNWLPWPKGADAGLDRLSEDIMLKYGFEQSVLPTSTYPERNRRGLLDIKTEVNMWPLDVLVEAGLQIQPVNHDVFFESCFSQVKTELEQWILYRHPSLSGALPIGTHG